MPHNSTSGLSQQPKNAPSVHGQATTKPKIFPNRISKSQAKADNPCNIEHEPGNEEKEPVNDVKRNLRAPRIHREVKPRTKSAELGSFDNKPKPQKKSSDKKQSQADKSSARSDYYEEDDMLEEEEKYRCDDDGEDNGYDGAATTYGKPEKPEAFEVYSNPDAERKLLSAILKAEKLDPAVGKIDLAYFDDEDIADLWFTLLRVSEPYTVNRIVKHGLNRRSMSQWTKDEIIDLKNEPAGDESMAELAEEVRRGFICREMPVIVHNMKLHASRGDLEELERCFSELQEDIKAARPVADDGMTSAELAEADCNIDYLIEDVLVAGQPMIIGAHSKNLKTTITIDMAISLGTGTKFLDRFPTQPVNVAMYSGESGKPTIKETALRIAKHKEVKLSEANCRWYFRVPHLSDREHLAQLHATILKHKLQVVIIDPLYLALHTAKTAGQAGNVFMAGALLGEVTKLGQETNCTIILLHHFRKTGMKDYRGDDPANLEELAQAGMAEWARQWILMKRREPYAFDGKHAMWMQTGGSAGHNGLWALDVSEGDNQSERIWQPQITSAHAFRQAEVEAKEQKKAADGHQKHRTLASQVKLYLSTCTNEADTAKAIGKVLHVGEPTINSTLAMMLSDREVTRTKVKKANGQDYDGFKLSTAGCDQEASDIGGYDYEEEEIDPE